MAASPTPPEARCTSAVLSTLEPTNVREGIVRGDVGDRHRGRLDEIDMPRHAHDERCLDRHVPPQQSLAHPHYAVARSPARDAPADPHHSAGELEPEIAPVGGLPLDLVGQDRAGRHHVAEVEPDRGDRHQELVVADRGHLRLAQNDVVKHPRARHGDGEIAVALHDASLLRLDLRQREPGDAGDQPSRAAYHVLGLAAVIEHRCD
jgi:hypothetical protein